MIINADNYKDSPKNGSYGGQAGNKDGIIINGENWLIKYPKYIGDMERTGGASYSTSPLSEYIGSHIFQIIGMPVHETMLVERHGKIAVACKDFVHENEMLLEIRTIKNHTNEKLEKILGIEFHSTGSDHVVDLRELLLHLKNNDILNKIPLIDERFWEQAVVDLFINNNDRNNGNWGIIRSKDEEDKLAPVFDNGGCFQTKISEEKIKKILSDPESARRNAANIQTAYGENGHPFSGKKFLDLYEQERGLANALIKIVPKIKEKLNEIYDFIDNVHEKYIGNNNEYLVCSKERKSLYQLQLQARYVGLLKPYLEKSLKLMEHNLSENPEKRITPNESLKSLNEVDELNLVIHRHRR